MTMDLPRPRILKTNEEVAAYYGQGQTNQFREGTGGGTPKKIRAFGDPKLPDWRARTIVPVALEGFGSDLKKSHTVYFHKALAKRLEKVFQAILAENRASSKPYILKTEATSGYQFRYLTNVIDDKWLHDPFYKEPLRGLVEGQDFRAVFAEWDRKRGTFDLLAPKASKSKIRGELLSDHAYGSAIDINYTDNNMVDGNTSTADMPRRIVEIFEANGFCWGGFYKNTDHDYMHFEWGRIRTPGGGGGASRSFFFPLELGDAQNPGIYYANNETCTTPGDGKSPPQTEGGFFPLSLPHDNALYLHGGIHLSPEGKQFDVHNLAPGYIVAARMAPKDHANCSETSLAAICNWTNFVLVRHDLEKPKGTLYSLYMHLKPVDTPVAKGAVPTKPQPLKGDLAEIPWLRQVFLGQYGMFIKVRAKASWAGADTEPLGACVWATEPYQKDACQATVITRDGKTVIPIGIRENAQDPQPLWEFKSPALEIANLWKLFSEGKTVTFTDPFLTVQGDAVLGKVGAFPGTHSEPKNDKGKFLFKVSPTFLHWEIFSPQEDSVITKLVNELVGKSGGALTDTFFPSLTSKKPEEAFTGEAISPKFQVEGALPVCSSLATKSQPYDLIMKYHDQASKGTKVDLGFDLGKMIAPSKLTPSKSEVTWKIEWIHTLDQTVEILKPAYTLHLSDTEARIELADPKASPDSVTLPPKIALTSEHWTGKTLVKFVVDAPLLADQVRIDGRSSSLTASSSDKQIGVLDFARFKSLVGTSFRSARLQFTSNWVPDANKALLSSAAGKAIPAGALTWWDPSQEAPGLPAASGENTKLFETELPADGKVETMNPITLKWILEMLASMKDTLQFQAPSPDKKANGTPSRGALKPVGAGILSKESSMAFGSELVLLVADEMYALGNEHSTSAFYELRLKMGSAEGGPSTSTSPNRLLEASTGGGAIPSASSLQSAAVGAAKSGLSSLFGSVKQELTGSPLREGVMALVFPEHVKIPVVVDDCGIFLDRRMADVWGECSLEIFLKTERLKTSPWGLEKVRIAPPQFTAPPASDAKDLLPYSTPKGLCWVIPLSVPADGSAFAGLVEVVILGENGARTPSGFCVRAVARPQQSPTATFQTKDQIKFDGDFVVGFNSTKKNQKSLTKKISLDAVKSLMNPLRIHQTLLLVLQDLFDRLGKPVKISAIESDGMGCLLEGDVTATATDTNLFSKVRLVDTRTRLRVVPAGSDRMLFEFDPLPAILEAHDEEPAKVLNKDYSFDFHVVAGMAGNLLNGFQAYEVFQIPKERPASAVASYPCPEAVGHYGALGFGELRARLYAPTGSTIPVNQWHFEMELAGNADLWSRQILEATISSDLAASLGNSQSIQTIGSVDAGRAVFVVEQPPDGNFLRTGKHLVKIQARPRAEGQSGAGASEGIKEFADSLLGPSASTDLECSRTLDLTPKLGAAATTRSAQGVQVAISTHGLLETQLPKDLAGPAVDAFQCQFVSASGKVAPLSSPHPDGKFFPATDGNLHIHVPQSILAALGDGRIEVRGLTTSPIHSLQIPLSANTETGTA